MAKWAVVADDLTGSNATGVLFVKKGLKVVTVVNYQMLPELVSITPNYHGLIVNTFSRGISPDEARKRVEETATILRKAGVSYFGKRIDSTARGNLGAEIEGMLSALGPEYIAVVVPAYPASGRIVVGGYLLVNGVPVERTEVGRDPKTPVDTSEVSSIIARQSSLPQGFIPLKIVVRGPEAIKAELLGEIARGRRIIVVDAVSDQDIESIAEAVFRAGIKAFAVDPGPFSSALLTKWAGSSFNVEQGKVLVVSGSASSLTRVQLGYLGEKYGASFINIDVRQLLNNSQSLDMEKAIINRLKVLSRESNVFGLRVAEKEDMVLNLETEARARGLSTEEVSSLITTFLARIAREVLRLGIPNLKGVYLTGGDMTVAFCEACHAEGIELKGEVLPLAAYGVLIGGEFAGLPIVTKGGLVGGPEGAFKCVEYLLKT
ncbi:MAG: four-carbon acid sugar kinase family protein [Thermanaeromonas sp.]|uniref:four-carbon acid sugar kinase family protein n=1 Tax=Thermanaeromonas sp. TaxID=2003697 RepID=UPI00243C6480|nr:four-carbon acid sugar kinase family protein [Thermanaeromonas sp.]MCG0277971.1 four-carbon acid sugar kinase family protein [Thermanaeromonas sp.]